MASSDRTRRWLGRVSLGRDSGRERRELAAGQGVLPIPRLVIEFRSCRQCGRTIHSSKVFCGLNCELIFWNGGHDCVWLEDGYCGVTVDGVRCAQPKPGCEHLEDQTGRVLCNTCDQWYTLCLNCMSVLSDHDTHCDGR